MESLKINKLNVVSTCLGDKLTNCVQLLFDWTWQLAVKALGTC